MSPQGRTVVAHAGAWAAALAGLAVLSWVGRGWGYLVVYGAALAVFGAIVASAGLVLRWRSRSAIRSASLAARAVRSFSRAQLTLGLALVLAAVLARQTSGPLGPFPGGPFEGSHTEGPMDLDVVLSGAEVQLQVPEMPPYTITTHAFVIDDALYVGADFVFPFKRWVHIVERDPRVLVRAGERIVPARAVRIRQPEEARRILEQVSRQRGVEPDDWLTDVWFFRMDPP